MTAFRFLGGKILHLSAVLLGVSFLVFTLLDLLPGDTAEVIAASSESPTPEMIDQIRVEMGLDDPLLVRYWHWLGNAVTGDLGVSYRTGDSVMSAIQDRMGVTIELLFLAEVVSLAVAIPVAVYAARHRDSIWDRIVAFFAFALQSVPNFMVALVLILVFAVNLRLLPAIGYVPLSEDVLGSLKSLTIPTLALAAGLIPLYLRVLRNEMIRTLQEDFILLARAQGLRPRTVLFVYALKPSMPTLITVVGINIGTLIGGTIIIELICGLPGVGTLLFNAINTRDFVLVQGIVLVIAAGYVVANFAVDLLYSVLDPRVRT